MVKCEIPSFVADFVSVVSWVENNNLEYFSNHIGILFFPFPLGHTNSCYISWWNFFRSFILWTMNTTILMIISSNLASFLNNCFSCCTSILYGSTVQQPQWPQWLLQPHFIKKITEFDVLINPGTNLTYFGLLMWDRSSKSHSFIHFGHFLFWRLWRTGMLLWTKSKSPKQKFRYSGFQNYLKTKSKLHISTCQSWLKYKSLLWDTLYFLCITT